MCINEIKVSAKSNPGAVASVIATHLLECKKIEIQTIGRNALHVAVKSIIIARGYMAIKGEELVCIPSFVDVVIDDAKVTAIKFILEKRSNSKD